MRVLRFGLIGLVAAAVHYGIAVGLTWFAGIPPQAANVCGYLLALLVSYHGQDRYTFARSPKNAPRFARFAATSLGGFLLNAASYASLLRFTSLDYRIALALVLGVVATLTYLVLGRWVFKPAAGLAA